MKKALLPLIWIVALIGIFKLADSFNKKSEHFFGLADNHEQSISFQYPVEIIQALALEGEDAKQGMPILEVRRNDLASSQSTLEEQIRKLELDKQEAKANTSSQLQSLTAKKHSALAEIDQQIHAIQTRIQLAQQNRMLLKSISGVSNDEIPVAPETFEIADLQKKRHFTDQAIQAEINNLTALLNAAHRPIDAQIAELKGNLAELQRQNKSLKVAAQFNGRIGSIHFKPGDLVPAYQPIMTVHSSTPRSVKGYIHENILNEVKVGQTVWIKSMGLDRSAPALEGVVESLGNRIVDYPERLKKDPQISTFGREVVVALPSKNPLLFGEKVDITLTKKEPAFQLPDLINTASAFIRNIKKPEPLHKSDAAQPNIMKNLEASAILWNPNEGHYLLLSDEQDDDKPGIFILDKDAVVTDRLTLQDGTSIDDLESISRDGDYIYVSSSLSYNKKDELKDKRKKLLRFKYRQHTTTSQQEIDLFKVLEQIKESEPEKSKLAAYLAQAMADHTLDIESHFVKDNALYLGFKAPFIEDNAALIIKLDNVEAIFAGKKTAAVIWQTIVLKDPDTGEPTQLSDMLLLEDRLILLSVSRSSTKNSHLWSYALKDKVLNNLHHFSGINAEGVTYRPELSSVVVVFDEGKDKTSQYQTIKISNADAKK